MIKCFRHLVNFGIEKEIEHADNTNADYIMATDTKVDEWREVFIALKHTPETLVKSNKGEPISDNEYEAVEIASLSEAVDAVRVKVEIKLKNIQKTGVICPDCYLPTDIVIWGVHK